MMDVINQTDSKQTEDPNFINYVKKGLFSEAKTINSEQAVEQYQGYTLTSAFQPIISVPHARSVGFEALVRAKENDGSPCSPQALFAIPNSASEHLDLDRLCRQVHLQNFARQENGDQWLFINLDSESISVEKPVPGFMTHILSASDIPAHRIVIEILESKIDDKDYILNIVSHFRSMGCLIAIDDFGAGHSNFDRIWELNPDIVKLDKSLIARAAVEPRIKRILNGMISLLHEAGSLALVEGVETKQEALVAIESNADLLQGFYFAKPQASLIHDDSLHARMNELTTESKSLRKDEALKLSTYLDNLKSLFKQAITALESKQALLDAVQTILVAPGVMCCYLLDEQGQQIGRNKYSKDYQQNLDQRFLPLMLGKHANWSHKHYHHRALSNPNEINITRPYLSVAGAQMCVTVSKVVMIDKQKHVLCCDLEWLDSY